jgi:hypothetical protein
MGVTAGTSGDVTDPVPGEPRARFGDRLRTRDPGPGGIGPGGFVHHDRRYRFEPVNWAPTWALMADPAYTRWRYTLPIRSAA